MRWPWQRQSTSGRLVVSWSAQTLSYVQAKANANGRYRVEKIGVERQAGDRMESFLSHLQSLGLHGGEVIAVLRPDQYQLLQIETPAVAPEEMRSAARYLIREMLDTHVDDITLDVMNVGDGLQKGVSHLFVVTATNAQVREIVDFGQSLQCPVTVVDIQENAQRNLQSAVADIDGNAAQAIAALVVTSDRQALLTITANGELFYSRRLDLPEGFLAMEWSAGEASDLDSEHGFMPVDEYVPDYSGSASHDYGNSQPTGGAVTGRERSQRLLVEVQRSLDLWDRTWSSLPLSGLRVYAGVRSLDLAVWLSQEMGQVVMPMDVSTVFDGLEDASTETLMSCLPLLGALLRTESAKN
jgi:MSHA biogenesis protein MshI